MLSSVDAGMAPHVDLLRLVPSPHRKLEYCRLAGLEQFLMGGKERGRLKCSAFGSTGCPVFTPNELAPELVWPIIRRLYQACCVSRGEEGP